MNRFLTLTDDNGKVRSLEELAAFCRERISSAEADGLEITDGIVVDLIADNSEFPLDTIRDALVVAGYAERFPQATAKHYGAAPAPSETPAPVAGIQWTELRYPCNDPENGPARRNPVNGCITCGSKEADGYDDNGECFSCNDRPVPTPAPVAVSSPPAKVKRVKPASRSKRWNDAAAKAEGLLSELQSALEELADIKSEYEEWRDNLPENLQNSALGEKLNAVADLEFGDLLDDADEAIQEAVNADLPLGFGRD